MHERKKKDRAHSAEDPDYQPAPNPADADGVEALPKAQPGVAVKRMRDAARQRRCYSEKKIRGLSAPAIALSAWMRNDPRNKEILLAVELAELAAATVSAAVEAAVEKAELVMR